MENNIKSGMDTHKMKPQILFEKGLSDCFNFRIPSLLATSRGTLIAAIDARVDEPGDNPNNIDKVIRRSADSGATWGNIQSLVDYPGHGRAEGAAATDPAMLEDTETGTLWMIFCHTPGGIGLWNSQPGTGFDGSRLRLLYDKDNNEYTLHENGGVFDHVDQKTGFTVDAGGYVYKNGDKIGNIYLANGPLLEARTSFLQAIYSSDDGITWSAPIDLNIQIKDDWMRFIGAGPGAGLQLKKGTHRGRLVFPVYFSNNSNCPRMSCCVIYSDDHGKTWHRGQSPNDGREWNGEAICARTLEAVGPELTEAQLIELENGDLRIYMRNHSGKKRVVYSTSKDGGGTWEKLYFDEMLINPVCQFSIIKYPELKNGKDMLLFSGAMDENERRNGRVMLSEDGGSTWTRSNTLQEGSFIYSCMTILPDNRIGILYESDADGDTKIVFESFDLAWLV